MAPEGGFIYKQVTNRCKGALVWSVLSSSVLVQGARARARLWLSGHTLLSGGVKRRERDVSCSLSGGQDSPFVMRSAVLIMLPADELQLGLISRQWGSAGVLPLFPGRRWWDTGTIVTIYTYCDERPEHSSALPWRRTWITCTSSSQRDRPHLRLVRPWPNKPCEARKRGETDLL